jgi:hypothetical protein
VSEYEFVVLCVYVCCIFVCLLFASSFFLPLSLSLELLPMERSNSYSSSRVAVVGCCCCFLPVGHQNAEKSRSTERLQDVGGG